MKCQLLQAFLIVITVVASYSVSPFAFDNHQSHYALYLNHGQDDLDSLLARSAMASTENLGWVNEWAQKRIAENRQTKRWVEIKIKDLQSNPKLDEILGTAEKKKALKSIYQRRGKDLDQEMDAIKKIVKDVPHGAERARKLTEVKTMYEQRYERWVQDLDGPSNTGRMDKQFSLSRSSKNWDVEADKSRNTGGAFEQTCRTIGSAAKQIPGAAAKLCDSISKIPAALPITVTAVGGIINARCSPDNNPPYCKRIGTAEGLQTGVVGICCLGVIEWCKFCSSLIKQHNEKNEAKEKKN